MEELSRRKKELERLVEVRGTKHINNSNHRRGDSKGHGKITYGKTGHITKASEDIIITKKMRRGTVN